jgi:hypothetical protein
MHVARHVAIATVIGFMAVLLSGPILGVLGILLPFALIGALLYVPYRMFVGRQPVGVQAAGAAGAGFFRFLVSIPFLIVMGIFRAIAFVFGVVWGAFTFVLGIVLPTVAGGILGGILGTIGGIEHQDAQFRVPAAILLGASIGLVAGLWPKAKPKQVVIVHKTDLQHA